jgi:hypothetical protein
VKDWHGDPLREIVVARALVSAAVVVAHRLDYPLGRCAARLPGDLHPGDKCLQVAEVDPSPEDEQSL